MDIKKLLKRNIRSLRAYQAEEIPCKIKLDANESPYGLKVLKTVRTNRYPDPEAKSLRKLAAKEFKVKTENILHGNGSDELIYYLITVFGGPVLYPVPTFSMYGIISQALGEKKHEITLDRDFDLNQEQMLKAMKKIKPKLIFLSSPNNPTGNCFSQDRILKIIKETSSPARSPRGEATGLVRSKRVTRHPALVVVDEAYQPFSEKRNFLPFLKKYKNLVILRTLSKIGLAGLRVGFMIAAPEIIQEVNKVRLPFNLNSLSQKLAVESLKNKGLICSHLKTIVSERKRLYNELKTLQGIVPYPSDANFILFRAKDSEKVYKGLLKTGVLIRNMKGIVRGCLRVTVGTPKENAIFLKNLRQLV
jgi:histidinol-phosphate aminotransferase